MRSVVVVLPASMCAMIPMLRVLSRGNSRAIACAFSSGFVRGRVGSVGSSKRPGAGPGRRRRVGPATASVRAQRADALHVTARIFTIPSVPQVDFGAFFACSLPAVMRERLVRFRHLLQILAALDGGPDARAGVEQLAG